MKIDATILECRAELARLGITVPDGFGGGATCPVDVYKEADRLIEATLPNECRGADRGCPVSWSYGVLSKGNCRLSGYFGNLDVAARHGWEFCRAPW